MKTRIVSSVIGIILLLSVMLLPGFVFGFAVSFLAAVGMYEFQNALEKAGYKPIRIIGYAFCGILPVMALLSTGVAGISAFPTASIYLLFSAGGFLAIVLLFGTAIFHHEEYSLNDISLTAFGMIYVIFLFSFLIFIRSLPGGQWFIWLVFIGAWVTDTFAYFTGITIGKTKILPVISPKKSLEGSIGGVAGGIIGLILYGMVINSMSRYSIPIYHYAIMGFLSGIISQLGDWAASAIKRYVKIKDYGKIMPGHGGVLDRFDSVLFVGPVIYFYLSIIIHNF